MPFTPFHFGPGLLVKGIAPRRFSWAAFIAVQVVIDCETLYYLVRHEHPVHRTLHTTPGATLAGVATALAVLGLRVLLESQANGTSVLTDFKRPSIRSEVSGPGTLEGGLAGGASHPLLGVDTLHARCVMAGLIGVVLTGLWLDRDGRAG